jgi:hypothetical protein
VAAAGNGVGEQGAGDHGEEARGGGRGDDVPVDQALVAVAEGAGDGAGEDRGEGGAHGDEGFGAEGPDAGVADDGAADAEQGAEDAGAEAEEEGEGVAEEAGLHGR